MDTRYVRFTDFDRVGRGWMATAWLDPTSIAWGKSPRSWAGKRLSPVQHDLMSSAFIDRRSSHRFLSPIGRDLPPRAVWLMLLFCCLFCHKMYCYNARSRDYLLIFFFHFLPLFSQHWTFSWNLLHFTPEQPVVNLLLKIGLQTNSAFLRYPNTHLVHYSCKDRYPE